MSAGIKANNDGSAAIQVGGSDYIGISATGDVTIPQNQTVSGTMTVTGTLNAPGGISSPSLGGNYVVQQYTSPTTWTKSATLKGVRVTVVGGGGAGGATANPGTNAYGGGGGGGGTTVEFIPAPSIPGPQPITAGAGTNSFGAFCSATGGSNAPTIASGNGPGAGGGSGSGGTFNTVGTSGTGGVVVTTTPGPNASGYSGTGGNAMYQILGAPGVSLTAGQSVAGNAASPTNYGAGGGGAGKANVAGALPGGAGAPGIVIVEEFY